MTTVATQQGGAVAERPRSVPVFAPVTDIFETKDGFIVCAEMPGVDADSVSVTLDRDVLRIAGSTKPPRPDGYSLIHAEYRPGDYERSFALAVPVDADRIDASVKDGVLKLVLPKAAPVAARKIVVKAQ